MGFGFARVRIKGIRISEGLLYWVYIFDSYTSILKDTFNYTYKFTAWISPIPELCKFSGSGCALVEYHYLTGIAKQGSYQDWLIEGGDVEPALHNAYGIYFRC